MKCFVQLVSFCLIAAIVFLVAEARADVFAFTYSDSAGDAAHGELTVQPSGLGDGSLWVTGGSIDVTAGSSLVGVYPLWAAGPSPTTGWNYTADNLLFPLDNGASSSNSGGITGSTYLSTDGLLFGKQIGVNVYQINIWGNGNADYAFADSIFNLVDLFNFYSKETPSGGKFDVTPVPEPASLTLLGTVLVGLGVVYLRRRRAKA